MANGAEFRYGGPAAGSTITATTSPAGGGGVGGGGGDIGFYLSQMLRDAYVRRKQAEAAQQAAAQQGLGAVARTAAPGTLRQAAGGAGAAPDSDYGQLHKALAFREEVERAQQAPIMTAPLPAWMGGGYTRAVPNSLQQAFSGHYTRPGESPYPAAAGIMGAAAPPGGGRQSYEDWMAQNRALKAEAEGPGLKPEKEKPKGGG